jgi:hypothetical protein
MLSAAWQPMPATVSGHCLPNYHDMIENSRGGEQPNRDWRSVLSLFLTAALSVVAAALDAAGADGNLREHETTA